MSYYKVLTYKVETFTFICVFYISRFLSLIFIAVTGTWFSKYSGTFILR